MKSKNRIEKGIESLEKQKKLHEEKIREHNDKDDFVIEYWEKEIERFTEQIKKEKEKLKKS